MERYIGRVLDNRYEILEVIGSGGMAVVYKAKCHRLNRLVAIKILKDENLQDEDFRRRFHAESQAVAMLSHPNIVSVYDVSMDSDEDYIVMELIEGISLKQYMEKKGVLNWKETLHFATQIAKALDHAHSKGLVHRDIKPHNVMVLKTGAVKVADFGIARMMSKSNTLTKEALGSVHYISPEQARGGRVDNRSDIYSLGVVMYEMITGRAPYDGESPVSVAIQHINGGAVKPSDLNPNIPAALEQIILKAMANDPKDRYANAAAMLQDLDEFRRNPAILVLPSAATEGTPVPHYPIPPKEKEPREVPAEKKKTPPKPVPPAPAPEKRRRDAARAAQQRSTIITTVVVFFSLLAMAAMVFFLITFLQPDNPVQEDPTVTVPNLVGMYYSRLTPTDGIEIVVQGSTYSDKYSAGQIIRQEPQGDEVVDYGTKVFITVSLGKRPSDYTVRLINMVGKTEAYAQQWLDNQGLELDVRVVKDYSSTIAAGYVISTDPAENTVLEEGDRVTLVVSLGKETDTMPDLLGITLTTAKGRMGRTNFLNVRWEAVNSELAYGMIVSQSLPANSTVAIDTEIVITYSNGIPPDAEPITIPFTFEELPASEEGYLLSILSGGEILLLDHWIEPDQTTLTMDLTGSNTVQYDLYINGVFYKTVTVEFFVDE